MFAVTLEGEAEFFASVRGFVTDLQQGAETVVADACQAGVTAAKQGRFKDQTGLLRKRIHWLLLQSSAAGTEAEIRSPAEYSSHVESGTKPHEIRPKMRGGSLQGPVRPSQSRRSDTDVGTNRVALRWFEGGPGGPMRFARWVRHPGSAAYPFMGPAYFRAEAVLNARMEALVDKAAARFR